MTEAEVREVFNRAVKAIETRAPSVNLVIIPHPDAQMRDMGMVVTQVYLTFTGKKEPVLFAQHIQERDLLESRLGAPLPRAWPKLSSTKLDNELED